MLSLHTKLIRTQPIPYQDGNFERLDYFAFKAKIQTNSLCEYVVCLILKPL